MRKLLMVLILAIPLSGSWKDLSIEERRDWVVRHFGKFEAERLERMNLLEDDWLFEGRQPESLNVRVVGRWPFGPTFEVTGDTLRNLVFQGSGSGVRILDISNMPNVNELSRIAAPYAGLIRGLAVRDTILVVLQGADGFTVYGITNATNPSELARIFIGQWLNDCFLKDSLLYIAGDDSLRIFNLKDPTNPVFVGGCSVAALGIYVQGSYAYLVYQNYMRIYDISNPTNPVLVGTWPGGVDCQTVWVSDTVAYIGTYNDGLQIINVKNVSSPFKITDYPCGDTRGLFMLKSPLEFLYLPDLTSLSILDVSDPSNPQLVDSIRTPGWAWDVWVTKEAGSGSYIFLGDYYEGLGIYDSNQPSNLQWLYQYGEAETAYDVVVQGNYLFLANNRAGVKVIDISNPQNPLEIECIRDPKYHAAGFLAVGLKDTVLLTINDWGIFMTTSISTPSNPRLLDTIDVMGLGQGSISVNDTIAYTAEAGIQAINISDPANLDTFRTFVLPPTALAYDIFAKDSLVYVPAGYAGFRIISYGDPWNPYEIGSFPISFASGIWVIDTLAYLGGDENGLVVLSVADPASPYQVGSANFRCVFVRVADSLAYIDGGGYFRILNILNPTNITEVGRHSFGGYQLWADSNYIYCACNERGIVIYEILEPGINEREIKGPPGNPLIPTIIRSGARLRFSPKSRVEVRDAVGRLIKTNNPGEEVVFSGVPAGVYFLIEKRGITTKVYKVVVIK